MAFAGLFYTELAKDVNGCRRGRADVAIIAFAMIFGATVLASQLIAFFLKQVAALFLLGLASTSWAAPPRASSKASYSSRSP